MVSLSRISPSMTMPAAPRAIISASMISPMMALGPAPPASTTITSPEPQMSMAWCTMRLSPGRVRTVSARPTSGLAAMEGPQRRGARGAAHGVADIGDRKAAVALQQRIAKGGLGPGVDMESGNLAHCCVSVCVCVCCLCRYRCLAAQNASQACAWRTQAGVTWSRRVAPSMAMSRSTSSRSRAMAWATPAGPATEAA